MSISASLLPPPDMPVLRRARAPLAAFALFLGIAATITWPGVTQLSTHGIGSGYGDQGEIMYLVWWAKYALQNGLNPFWHSLLAYPDGFFSPTLWAEPLRQWPSVPLAFIVGPVAAANLMLLITLALNGLAAFYLCWRLAQPYGGRARVLAALFGGAVFEAYPAAQGHISGGHMDVLTLYGLPIVALALWEIVRGSGARRWVWVWIGGAAFALTALGNGAQVVYTLFPLSLFYLLYHLLFEVRFLLRRAVILRLAGLYALGALICVPFFAPLAIELLRPVRTADLEETGWVRYSADPLAFISPSPFTPWGRALAPAYARTVLGTNTNEGTAYPGFITLAACAVGALILRRNAGGRPLAEARDPLRIVRPWVFILAGAMVFSLGPVLKWADQPIVYRLGDDLQTNLTLPYAVFQVLPFFSSTRTPGRFNLLAGLALAVTAAVILARLVALWDASGASATRRRRWSALGILVLIGVMLVDTQLFFPEPTTPAVPPAFFSDLAARRDLPIRAVFDIPWDNPLAAKEATLLQTAHHKPLIAGHVVRSTPVNPAKLRLIEAAAYGRVGPGAIAPADADAFLSAQGVDLIIAHQVGLSADQIGALDARFGAALYRDPAYVVYRVPPVAANRAAPPLLTAGDTVYQAAGGLVEVVPRPDGADLALDDQPLNADAEGNGSGPLIAWLPAGFHTVEGAAALKAPPAAALRFEAPVRFGDSITLLGAAAVRSPADGAEGAAETLRVSLTWRAERPWTAPETADLRIFVHVLDARGEVAAQADPNVSGAWGAGQLRARAASIGLKVLPPGRYTLVMGWYQFATGHRLPIATVQGGAGGSESAIMSDHRVKLAEFTISSPP